MHQIKGLDKSNLEMKEFKKLINPFWSYAPFKFWVKPFYLSLTYTDLLKIKKK